jgi:hypothetical protein
VWWVLEVTIMHMHARVIWVSVELPWKRKKGRGLNSKGIDTT